MSDFVCIGEVCATDNSARVLAVVGVIPGTGEIVVAIDRSGEARLSTGAAKHLASLVTEANQAVGAIAGAYRRYQEAVGVAGAVYADFVKPFSTSARAGN